MSERTQRMLIGVVIERRELDNPWQDAAWRPVAVIAGAPPVAAWRELDHGPGWVRYHAATLPLELHHKETEAYLVNLSSDPPRIYVVLAEADDEAAPHEVVPFLVTASPYDAQDYLDSGEELVEGVPMPPGVVAWVRAFVAAHHVDEPFRKRKRVRFGPEDAAFSRPPRAARRGGGGNGRG